MNCGKVRTNVLSFSRAEKYLLFLEFLSQNVGLMRYNICRDFLTEVPPMELKIEQLTKAYGKKVVIALILS